jgi:riboflavin kinase/FMN adenylyltransferase
MQIVPLTISSESLRREFPPSGQVLAVGDFDGVHLGHREVIRRAVKTAADLKLPASVMTFHPHPREVLGQERYALSLTPMERKMELFAELGLDYVYVVTFDENLMRMQPEQFVEQMLLPLRVETVIVGFDFTFGFQGKGTPDTLAQLSKGKFAVEVVRPFQIEDCKVSSTAIRDALDEGDVQKAAKLLGRRYSIRGKVVHGDARGRTIGFPTANLSTGEAYVIPRNGVYAIKAEIDGKSWDGVMNIGVKPTFATGELKRTIEAHLFDFSQDIYGKEMSIEFVAFIRSERKFASVQELIEQIRRDAETAKKDLHSV